MSLLAAFTNDNGVLTLKGNITCYPLTHPQLGIWYTEKLYPGTSIGNIAATLKFKEKIDIDLLEKSINLLIKNHDSFRLRFKEIDGKPVQYVTEYRYQKIDFIDFSDQDIESLYRWDTEQTKIPFELIDSDLFYFAILKVSEYEFAMYTKLHHLICDGWSMVMTGNIVMDFYNQLRNGSSEYIYKSSSYIDYINAEDSYIRSSRFADDQQFWDSRLRDLNISNNMSFRKKSNSNKVSTEAKRKTFILPNRLTLKIHEYAQANKTTVPAIFLSALLIYLNRVTGNAEHIVGIPVLNRTNAKEKRTCGMFINTVPLDISIDENISFCSLVTQITQEWLVLLRHQRYPFELIKKNVEKYHSITGNIYNILLSYQNAKFIKEDGILEHEGRWHFNGRQVTPLYIHINEREDNGNIIIDYDFLTDLFYAKEIDFIHDHMLRLLWHGLDNPAKSISRLEIVSEKEKQKILYDFNNTQAEYPTDTTISEIFEEQVRVYPDNTAVIDRNNRITYKSLHKKANKLARVLRDKGVGANTVVGIIIDPSIEMIIAIMGILKAGGTYLPLDPAYPQNRLAYYITDSKPLLIIISEEQFEKNKELIESTDLNDDQFLLLDSILNDGNIDAEEYMGNINSPTDAAYIIYTSGSTGNPKGVLVEHRNVVRLLFNSKNRFDFTSDDVWTMFHSYCFDFSVWEIFGALLYGGKLVIVPKATAQDPEEFLKLLLKHKVTVLNQIPTAFYNLSNAECSKKEHKLNVRYIIFGGETLKPAKLREWKSIYPDVKMINMYGITETTVHSTYKEVNTEMIRSNQCNIGVPIPTTTVYIFDKYKQLVPIGVKGEIYVGGDGVTKGYLNRPELTDERFMPNPYKPEERIYKSGDAGRWYANGEIEYLGRLDFQIKIHGFRIELGEIENKISEFPGIIDVAVLSSEDEAGDNILIAYFVANRKIDVPELRRFLGLSLPQYMIPAEYKQLESMPLTSSGKINKKELSKIKYEKTTYNEYYAPRNESEAKMAEIWQDVLGIKRIGIKDNFFELGADSLKIIQVQVKAVAYDWGIKTQDFYKYPTIELLYDNVIKKQDKVNYLLNNEYNYKISDILKPEKHKTFKNVLLTGATGFVGIHLLHALLYTTDANIYCLLRKDSIYEDLKCYFGDIDEELLKRITVIRGDITKDCLGLDSREYEFLAKNIDTIIHSAANVRHYGSFDEFNKTNVEGTREVLILSKKCNAVFHHISTISVSGTNLMKSLTDSKNFTENDFFIGQNVFENVYLHTKFEAERLVLDEASRGMKVNIYRLGNITARYCDGVFQRNITENAFYRRIKSILMIGAVSEQMANIEIEMTPVDICSKTIIDIIKRGRINCIYHLYNKKFKVRKLVEVLNNLSPGLVRIVDNDEFIRVIKEISEDREKQYSLEGLINEINSTTGIDYDEEIITSNSNTFEILKDLDIVWPDTQDVLYIKKMIIHMMDAGFIEKGNVQWIG